MRAFVLSVLLLSVCLNINGQESSSSPSSGGPSRRRSQRKTNGIQSLLQQHSSSAANAPSLSQARSSNSAVTLPPIYNRWIQWDPRWDPPNTSTTTAAPDTPASQWYYKDDSDYVQGPYNSSTMLKWHKEGYFRQSLLLRREIDDVFMTLAGFTKLYGRIPFSQARSPISEVTLPPIYKWDPRWDPPTTTTTTPAPDTPASQWYYKDDSDYVQGPYNSSTMLKWHKAGYFRQSLLLRREIDDVFMTLAGFTKLYGRIPFNNGNAPGPLSSPPREKGSKASM